MKEENNSFFVVRKGDLVGVYKNFSDCQAQVGSSVNNLLRITVNFLTFLLDNSFYWYPLHLSVSWDMKYLSFQNEFGYVHLWMLFKLSDPLWHFSVITLEV